MLSQHSPKTKTSAGSGIQKEKKMRSRGTKGSSFLEYPRSPGSKSQCSRATAQNEDVLAPLNVKAVPAFEPLVDVGVVPATERRVDGEAAPAPVPAPMVFFEAEDQDAVLVVRAPPGGHEPVLLQLLGELGAVLAEDLPVVLKLDDVAIVDPLDGVPAEAALLLAEEPHGLVPPPGDLEGDADVLVDRRPRGGLLIGVICAHDVLLGREAELVVLGTVVVLIAGVNSHDYGYSQPQWRYQRTIPFCVQNGESSVDKKS